MKTQQLKELAQRATPWPWKWFTSNSHNRLSSVPSGKDGDVISAFKAVDGVSCVSVSRADMAFIEASHPGTVLELIDRIEAAERERDEYAEGERLTAIKNVELQDEIYGLKAELARRDAAAGEPVAWISERNLKDLGKAFSVRVKHEPVMVRPIALYTAAQPQPVVVSPADSVPDGWKLVPIEPTEDMVISGFESQPSELFSGPAVWDAFEAMSGCQQASHKARLCYAAMLAAAPAPGGG